MAIVINGSGTVTGISQGGLPDDVITADDIKDSDYQAPLTAGTDYLAPDGDGSSLTGISAGKVVQTVMATHSTETSTTSTSFTSTGLTASITPSSSSNKVLVLLHTQIEASTSDNWCYYTIYRGGTNLGDSSAGFGGTRDSENRNHSPASAMYLDSPSTTSSTTYTSYFRSGNGGSVWHCQALATIVLLEIEPN